MTETNYEDEIETNYGDLENLDLEIASNNTLLISPYLAKLSVLKDIISIVKFDIMQSSPQADQATTIID